jgi:hypothetical protein
MTLGLWVLAFGLIAMAIGVVFQFGLFLAFKWLDWYQGKI